MRAGRETDKLEIGCLYGFRALMALLVANFHFWQQSWLGQYATLFGRTLDFDYITRASYVFVDGLILLSGFLHFLPHAQAMENGAPPPSARRFYRNRLIRILPSYLFAVLVALFCFALPQGSYGSAEAMRLDIVSHLTLTFTFFSGPYLHTPLGGALWTIAIEMQFYLIFPLLAKGARKNPALTLGLMTAAARTYRLGVERFVPDTAMYINQLPAFLDVYALGMLGAALYLRLRKRLAADGARRGLVGFAAVLALGAGVLLTLALLRLQSAASVKGVEALRLSQMRLRLPLALALTLCMLSSAFLPRALRWLLDNRLARFLSGISFNFYIWHQILAAQFATRWFPSTLHTDNGLQWAFTLLCWCGGLVAAMIATYGLEKPAANRINQWIRNREEAANNEGPKTGNA